MHTPADLTFRPISCTPDEWQELLDIVQEMSHGHQADLLRACLAVDCRRVVELRDATGAHERNLLALVLHAAGAINETLNLVDFMHDPEPVRRFLDGIRPDQRANLCTNAGWKEVARVG